MLLLLETQTRPRIGDMSMLYCSWSQIEVQVASIASPMHLVFLWTKWSGTIVESVEAYQIAQTGVHNISSGEDE